MPEKDGFEYVEYKMGHGGLPWGDGFLPLCTDCGRYNDTNRSKVPCNDCCAQSLQCDNVRLYFQPKEATPDE
jgi:hypothetical protein